MCVPALQLNDQCPYKSSSQTYMMSQVVLFSGDGEEAFVANLCWKDEEMRPGNVFSKQAVVVILTHELINIPGCKRRLKVRERPSTHN